MFSGSGWALLHVFGGTGPWDGPVVATGPCPVDLGTLGSSLDWTGPRCEMVRLLDPVARSGCYLSVRKWPLKLQWLAFEHGDTWQHPMVRTLTIHGPDPGSRAWVGTSPSRFWAMTLLSPWAINWRGTWAWLRLSTFGDFVSMLESAWIPSNSLVLARAWFDYEWVILVRCIERLHRVTLGVRVASRWCFLLLEVATS
jgi:hypothetical protein